MNRLSADRCAAVVQALLEGTSIRTIARATGVAKNTVARLLGEVGAACLKYQREHAVSLSCKRIQCGEIWTFAGMKEKQPGSSVRGLVEQGDAWTWVAICADSKLVAAFHVGKHTRQDAESFIVDLAGRLANRVQLTTDGYRAYLTAIEDAFDWNGVDYTILDQIYESAPEGEKHYGPAARTEAIRKPIMGGPYDQYSSSTYVERQKFSIRMQTRRHTRLANAFSKKMENHRQAVALHFMHYNYCRPHMTLAQERNGIYTTPAMAAGLTDHVWRIEELISLLRN
ncbi:MAG: IS1 family transposase [Anaerolineae bacterium]|nr:IS1 family transposase [Gemmatimonadaceae bacterium]